MCCPRSCPKACNNVFVPFLNTTIFHLMDWFYSGSPSMSVANLQSLVDGVLLAPDFKVSDLKDFNARCKLRRLDEEGESVRLVNRNGWQESTVNIKLPGEKVN